MQTTTNPFQDLNDRLDQIETVLKSLTLLPSDSSLTFEEQPITITEAAEITHLAKATIYGLTHKKIVPHFRRGRRLFFLRSELIAWIKAGRRQTLDEIRTDAAHSLHQR